VRRIATVEDDALVAALKSEWSAAKAQREAAEARLAELEGIERDLQSDRAEVEKLREVWKSWSATLAQAAQAAPGSIPAEAQAQARQILKKVLTGPICLDVLPEKLDGQTVWFFEGYSRFDGILAGGAIRGLPVVVRFIDEETGKVGAFAPHRPIAGGSDGVVGDGVRSTDMAPHTPNARSAPAEPWRSSITRVLIARSPWPRWFPCRRGCARGWRRRRPAPSSSRPRSPCRQR
jgi:hypothetical protein